MKIILFALLVFETQIININAAQSDVVVIVNKNFNYEVNSSFLSKIFLGREKEIPQGPIVQLLDLSEGDHIRDELYEKLVDKNPSEMKSHWSYLMFTGKGLPPKVVSSEDEMKRMVAESQNAIGYISSSKVDSSVKVLLQLK
ncbi:MAG: phosphate ABC transporter substrate-binding protein [Xanthomonadaceae bacterium]|nr:phosphate ABC transporter substrate-binding protein [Xanthomonadaceae bacterium]